MNVNNNHLLSGAEYAKLPKEDKLFYTEIPKHLQHEAEKELDGKSETIVPINSKSPLAKWAAKVRKNNGINLD